jgi:hypothetical protein
MCVEFWWRSYLDFGHLEDRLCNEQDSSKFDMNQVCLVDDRWSAVTWGMFMCCCISSLKCVHSAARLTGLTSRNVFLLHHAWGQFSLLINGY